MVPRPDARGLGRGQPVPPRPSPRTPESPNKDVSGPVTHRRVPSGTKTSGEIRLVYEEATLEGTETSEDEFRRLVQAPVL